MHQASVPLLKDDRFTLRVPKQAAAPKDRKVKSYRPVMTEEDEGVKGKRMRKVMGGHIAAS